MRFSVRQGSSLLLVCFDSIELDYPSLEHTLQGYE